MSTLNKDNQYLKHLCKCSNDQSFHLTEGNFSNSNDIIGSLDQIQWTHLTSLNLSSNKLRDITLLTYTDSLEILNLSNNCLTNISPLISCKKLISLDCSKNEIHELPELNELPFLEELNASHNPLMSISGLCGCLSLHYLDLTSCQLPSSSITGLDDNDIQLGAIDPFEKYDNLSFYSNRQHLCLNNIQPTFLGIPHLRVLNLSYNPNIFHAINIQLTSNEWFIIQNVLTKKYSTFNQDYNKYSMFNESINKNSLNEYNGLGLLPYKIEYLNLQACNIQLINGLTHMKCLHTLNLSHNQIVDYQTLKPLKLLLNLQNLNLKNNPICDQNNYFQKVIFCLNYLKILDDCQVSIMDKVRSLLYNEPSLEQLAKEDHRVNLLHQFTKPQQLRDCTLSNINTSYPILAIIGPIGMNKRRIRKLLHHKLDNYFAPLICYTDRMPRSKLKNQLNSLNNSKESSSELVLTSRLHHSSKLKKEQSLNELMHKFYCINNDYNNEIDGVDYHFVNSEVFNKKRIGGEFIQTVNIMSHQYGLSWETLESVARRGLAGIVVGELELLYGLRLAGLKPRCILCLPNKAYNHERILRVKMSQIDSNQSELLCNDGILETSLEKLEEWIEWCIERTTNLYPQANRDNPGMFDAVLSVDNTQELFEQLHLLVLDYLGLNSSNEYSHGQTNNYDINEV
ncbi:hypothetical protein MN116_008360 [Schistosoma mekongi]|uniref:Guanylate kinase-like domain-containing protein n=1 Tax=Schistosoma mekongi TaxID=38744 RepID=A0AAE1Z604_SCHME|nr:hypothetical protein MN116_008360 [Schistosoma mekongi]